LDGSIKGEGIKFAYGFYKGFAGKWGEFLWFFDGIDVVECVVNVVRRWSLITV
jgi:hypothetical protein